MPKLKNETHNPDEANVVSLSGGKDSTALALLALEKEPANLAFVFADTGNEHPLTYEYVEYLEQRLGPIMRLRANFDDRIANKREVVADKWRRDGVPEEHVLEALEYLQPTGNPFLDLCMWKGRFPSTRVRFCSEQLKAIPINRLMAELTDDFSEVYSWIGIRHDESRDRADAVMLEDSAHIPGLMYYRPILKWTAEDCFAMHKKHGIEPNPLYKMGMGRVGCMPCIHAGKDEVFEIAKRFPEELERLAKWEELVGKVAKRGVSTFFDARITQRSLGLPKITAENVHTVSHKTHGITAYVEWSKTSRGGRQYDLTRALEFDEPPVCKSLYGLCE